MENAKKILALVIALMIIVIGLPLILGARGEALPSPAVKNLYKADGALKISGAPDSLMMDWVRVDLAALGTEERLKAEIQIPYEPPDLCGVVLYDGWHFIQGQWTINGNRITVTWDKEILEILDGTVGLYLIWIMGV